MSKPNYTGLYHMTSQENMDEYLKALGKMKTLLAIFLPLPVSFSGNGE